MIIDCLGFNIECSDMRGASIISKEFLDLLAMWEYLTSLLVEPYVCRLEVVSRTFLWNGSLSQKY